MFNQGKRRKFNLRLNRWFKENARRFPWREKHNLYPLLVAEILLQRTNADKVAIAYNDILRRYPTPEKLIRAKKKVLKKIISPLGLIGKIEIIKSMAKDLILLGDINPSREQLLKIKGVGDYIANSVLIHLREERRSLLDPNLIRIYRRVFGIYSNASRPRSDKELWEKSLKLMPIKNISRYIYAMLDFGALVCRAKNPKCLDCPMYDDVCEDIDNLWS